MIFHIAHKKRKNVPYNNRNVVAFSRCKHETIINSPKRSIGPTNTSIYFFSINRSLLSSLRFKFRDALQIVPWYFQWPITLHHTSSIRTVWLVSVWKHTKKPNNIQSQLTVNTNMLSTRKVHNITNYGYQWCILTSTTKAKLSAIAWRIADLT